MRYHTLHHGIAPILPTNIQLPPPGCIERNQYCNDRSTPWPKLIQAVTSACRCRFFTALGARVVAIECKYESKHWLASIERRYAKVGGGKLVLVWVICRQASESTQKERLEDHQLNYTHNGN